MNAELPIPLARAMMAVMPSAVLSRAVTIIVRKVETRHPRLFANLARLPVAVVHLEPTDLPHKFTLTLGESPVRFYVRTEQEEKADARIAGSLQVLIDMLEGRADGDTLFFSRDIVVEGDTTIIVGLRNTLDREEINLYDEVLALCGPFAKPAGLALRFAERAGKHLRERLSGLHNDMHRREDKAGEHGNIS